METSYCLGKVFAMSVSLFVVPMPPMPKADRRPPPVPPRCSSTMGMAWYSWATTARGTRRKTINTDLQPKLHTICSKGALDTYTQLHGRP